MANATLPQNFTLDLYRGDDYVVAFVYGVREADTNVSMITSTEGWTARAQIRSDYGRDLWIDLTEENGLRLEVIDGNLVVYMHISASATSGVEWNRRDWGVWDLEIVDPTGMRTTIFAGEVNINADVTQEVFS